MWRRPILLEICHQSWANSQESFIYSTKGSVSVLKFFFLKATLSRSDQQFMWFITQRCQTLFCCRFSSMKICNLSVFCFSSINCNTYMSNFPVTLSEISHLSISGLQHEDRHPHTLTFTTKGSRQAVANCDTSSELEVFHARVSFFFTGRIHNKKLKFLFCRIILKKRFLMSSSLGGFKENSAPWKEWSDLPWTLPQVATFVTAAISVHWYNKKHGSTLFVCALP